VIEDALAVVVAAQVGPLRLAVERLTVELAELRKALPTPLVTIEEAAQALEVSVSSVRRAIRRGDVPVRRIGRSVRVDLRALRPLSEDEVAVAACTARSQP
jgi:excisionase family DNA binding protein